MSIIIMLICVTAIATAMYNLGKKKGRQQAMYDLNRACYIALEAIEKEELGDRSLSQIMKGVFANIKSTFQQMF